MSACTLPCERLLPPPPPLDLQHRVDLLRSFAEEKFLKIMMPDHGAQRAHPQISLHNKRKKTAFSI